ncbi:MAG: hypothetical protein JSV56_11120 [Methanomassiliicoccales archaeon]|nr:MAG: hypothetical protein JSV56_11120 [Methanomassiliicoccales archaeon]
MTLIDDIIKWLMAPKTLKGIAGMIVIIIVLALDFSYWAGAIDVSDISNGSSEGDEDEETDLPEDYDSGVITDSLPHGRNLVAFQQMVGDPRGEGEGETYKLYPVPVEANITKINIESDGDGGGARIDGGDRNDIDLYLYSPEKEAGGDFDTTDPDYEGASPYITEAITVKKKAIDLGNWTLRVDCYTGNDVSYTIQIQVFYGGGNETEEEP